MSQSKFSRDGFFNRSVKQQNKLKLLDKSIKTVIKNGSVEGFPPGIVINEYHSHKFPKEFLIANFQYFKSLGIETLFFEFGNDENQHLFDQSLDSNGTVAINSGLINGDDETKAVAAAANQAGIRIVVLDCKKAREGSPEYFRRATKEDWNAYYERRDASLMKTLEGYFLRSTTPNLISFTQDLHMVITTTGFQAFFPARNLLCCYPMTGLIFKLME